MVEEIDLEAIEWVYRVDRGQLLFDPANDDGVFALRLLQRDRSSRRIAKACRERVDVNGLVGLDPPDFRTISEFRRRHLQALLAVPLLEVLAGGASGLVVKLGHVALYGTKIKANASKHKAMSYERMAKRAAELEAEVASLDGRRGANTGGRLDEDAAFGRDKSGEEMPDWVADKMRRAEKQICAAKAELEAEAEPPPKPRRQARAEAEEETRGRGPQETRKTRRPALGRPRPESAEELHRSREPHHENEGRLHPGLQRAGGGGRRRAGDRRPWPRRPFERPASTDADGRCGRSQHGPQARAGLGRLRGHRSDANLEAMERQIDATSLLDAPSIRPTAKAETRRVAAMREKIRAGGQDPLSPAQATARAAFGQIKQARGFRRVPDARARQGRHEWGLVCLAHKTPKLAQGRSVCSVAEITPA